MKSNTNPYKQAGVEAFAASKSDNSMFNVAKNKFERALQQNPNDPETLIYLNNAIIGNRDAYKIAVSVPIGSNVNVAQEILRGVAQAQKEVNEHGGIKRKPLQIKIADDNNDLTIAKGIAVDFVDDPKILAVIGHDASDVSLAAAEFYKGNLVMVSPTSISPKLTGFDKYIFRTVPDLNSYSDILAEYIVKVHSKAKVAVCADSKTVTPTQFESSFKSALTHNGGKLISIDCNMTPPDFDASKALEQAIENKADSLLLIPYVDRIQRAIEVAQANKGRLALFGSPTLYTFETLQLGKDDVKGMVLEAPWSPANAPNRVFIDHASKLWKATVNWRTALAYDAAEAIITGLKQNDTRAGLQSALNSSSFFANGATGTIKFKNGNRDNLKLFLVEVDGGSKPGTDFVPLPENF